MARHKRRGPPRKPRRNYKREYEMSLRADKQPVGAPNGSQDGLSHGIVAFKNEVKRRARRGRSLIDRRTKGGRTLLLCESRCSWIWAASPISPSPRSC